MTERIHRPDSEDPAASPGRAGSDSNRLEEARELAAEARENLRAIDAVLGTFAVDDLRNSGGQ